MRWWLDSPRGPTSIRLVRQVEKIRDSIFFHHDPNDRIGQVDDGLEVRDYDDLIVASEIPNPLRITRLITRRQIFIEII